jgi:spermidine/putrescine transport system permease protein
MFSNPRNRFFFLAPGLGYLALFLLIPCGIIFYNSFFERGVYGGIDYVFTLENYRRALDPLYLNIFLNSAKIAGLATLLSILIAYPAAYAINQVPTKHHTRLLLLVMLPFWSSYLIRTYAWMVLLNREGIINSFTKRIGIGELPLLYNEFAIVLGLIYSYLPFVILTIYASLNRLNPEIMEASSDLGASAHRTFWRVILPLTLPGIASGAVFVFVLSIGNFLSPDLLGGGRIQMVGNLIYDQFLTARDWPFGAALALFLIAIMMILLFLQATLTRRAAETQERYRA